MIWFVAQALVGLFGVVCELPSAVTDQPTVILDINVMGEVTLPQRKTVSTDAQISAGLARELEAARKAHEKLRRGDFEPPILILRCDRNVSVQSIYRLMEIANKNGFRRWVIQPQPRR